MNRVRVRIPAPLRPLTGGLDEVLASGATVRAALDDLGRSHAGILEGILERRGKVHGFVQVLVDGRSIDTLAGLDSPIPPDGIISFRPALAGTEP